MADCYFEPCFLSRLETSKGVQREVQGVMGTCVLKYAWEIEGRHGLTSEVGINQQMKSMSGSSHIIF